MHRRRFALFTAACMAALVLASVPAVAGHQVLSGHVPQAVAQSQVEAALPASTRLNLAIGLPLRNQEKLEALLAQLSDPASPNFRHYLTPAQFAAQFGPTEADYQALIKFVNEKGLVVTATHPNRMLLDVSGTVPEVENALQVKMMSYIHPARGRFFAPDREPSLDLDVQVLSIGGLNNFVLPQPMGLKAMSIGQAKPLVTGSGPYGYFIGKDFRAAYAPGVTLTGSGQVVGLLEFDGFYAGDVTKNAAAAGVAAVPTQTVLLDGYNGAPGSGNIEVILDIMMASYMAPGLSKVLVYEGYYPDDVLNRMATDNQAQQLSSSWGFPIDATTEQIFKQFIAQGQSLMQASGDSGAYWNGVMTPSDDPNLTVVGGTSLTTSGASGPWQSEAAWSGSGGGISTSYAIPSYQQGLSMAACGGSTKMRNIPDVALTADVQMYLIFNNGQATSVGGTSAAAPLWAGFIALANQQGVANGKSRLGFINPLVYAIGNSSNYANDFHDIRTGNNGYAAVSGYDLATGWGSPAGQHLINDLTGASGTASFGLSTSASALTVKQGGTGTATITVTPKNGFSGSVSLTVTGLPSGVTAAFSPASATTTSTVTFTVGATAAPGTYALTVKGTSGSLSSTAAISLSVVSPSFSLSASAASLTVRQGTSAGSVITVSGQNGFSGSVSLAASGLPSGVTAAFNPASTASTSTVTFSVGVSAAVGTYSVVIKGTSGSLSNTVTISLSVVTPSFSLSASPASLTAPQGKSASSVISVSGQNGFSGSVSLAASGLPTGVTAAFNPASTSTTSTVTFSVGASVAVGTYPVVIKGTSGSLSNTVTISLSVVAPSFSLSASPASLTVRQGTSAGSVISVSGQNGFGGSVSLAASGLPAGVTAAFNPASTSTTSIVTFAVGASAAVGSYPIAIKGTSGSLSNTVTISLSVVAPSFSLATSAASLNVSQGSSGNSTITVNGQNGFTGTVTLAASGLPSGVTAVFNPASTSTTSTVTFNASSSAVVGTSTVTVTGTSGALTSTASIALTIAPVYSTTTVNLSPAYNITALVRDLVPFSGGGLDGGLNGISTAYSANLISGQNGSVGGVPFSFGPANAPDAVSGQTVALPAGQFSTIKLLATGVNGNQPAQTFKVTYTDGTVSAFSQGVSDWFTPQNYAGETKAVTMIYRDTGFGQLDVRTFYLYEYTFTLNTSKTVASITLPNNRNVVLLAATLTKGTPSVR